jgi:hypothetical protein
MQRNNWKYFDGLQMEGERDPVLRLVIVRDLVLLMFYITR